MSAKQAKLKVKKSGKYVALVDAVKFEIYDTGIGINKENQTSMFQLFGKVMQKNKSINKEGIGLGLYITKNLVSELGGIIELKSTEGSYTKFTITIPVERKVRIDHARLNWLRQRKITFPVVEKRIQEQLSL